MLAEKPSPIVAEIEGKIYVLSGAPWHMDCLLPTPTFEVYDPLVGKWEALPEPPFYAAHSSSDCYDYHVLDYSEVGTTIYVVPADYGGENYFSYCVNDKEWKSLGKSPPNVGIPDSQSPCCLCLVASLFLHTTTFLTPSPQSPCCLWDSLLAAWIPSVGSPICYQALKEVSEDYFLRDMVSESGVVLDLGEHEMCIMNPGLLLEADPSLEELQSEDLLSDDPIPGRTTL